MGILESALWGLLGGPDVDYSNAPDPLPDPTPQEYEPDPDKTPLLLAGDEERTIYTYDPAPLRGTRKGSKFEVDVVTRHTSLVSPLGGSWDSSDGGVALAYNGRVFGMTNALAKTLRDLDARGYAVRLGAERVGMFEGSIPEIVLRIPDPEEIFL